MSAERDRASTALGYARHGSHGTPASATPGGSSPAGVSAPGARRKEPTAPPRAAAGSSRSPTIVCPTCSGPVDVGSRHVAVSGGAVRLYCSAHCLATRDALPADAATVSLALPPKRSRARWWIGAGIIACAGAGFAFTRETNTDALVPPAPAVSSAIVVPDPQPSSGGDPQSEAIAAISSDLRRDTWIHPLAGPTRRMPRNHNGAFGAVRDGERPPECVSGHCGVDLGYIWGEPVYAVHDGVIDFVNRGPNEDRGGAFVRIAHRGGTLYSWYFHLAAVPRGIRPGLVIRAGTLIGLVGDTGVKHSAPHLHFALSVKTSKHARERYLDPEPLIAIWPLWIPNEDRTDGRISMQEEPGLPVRAHGAKKRKSGKKRAATAAAPPAEAGAAPTGSADAAAETID